MSTFTKLEGLTFDQRAAVREIQSDVAEQFGEHFHVPALERFMRNQRRAKLAQGLAQARRALVSQE